MTKASTIRRLQEIVREIEKTKHECGIPKCSGCKWNLKVAKIVQEAIKHLEV